MSLESFVRAMPKVELYVQLEGAMQKDSLLLIAEQNEANSNPKQFNEWVKQLDTPNYERCDELGRVTSGWLQQAEDLTRITYDVGVGLSKQNVRYAEVCVNPTLYMQNGQSIEEVLEALNDGRDRARRGWGVNMVWVLVIPRDEPRKGDEIARWATTAGAKKAGVVALGLTGREDIQPVGQFERAFRTAEKKGLSRAVQAGDKLGAEGILEAIQSLSPERIYDAWGAAEAPDVLQQLRDNNISISISMARALCMGWTQSYASYPLRHLYDEDIKLTIGTGMPSIYKSTLGDEYLAVVEHAGFSLEELEELALNAVRTSFQTPEEKETMLAEFTEAYSQLRAEHLESEEAK